MEIIIVFMYIVLFYSFGFEFYQVWSILLLCGSFQQEKNKKKMVVKMKILKIWLKYIENHNRD